MSEINLPMRHGAWICLLPGGTTYPLAHMIMNMVWTYTIRTPPRFGRCRPAVRHQVHAARHTHMSHEHDAEICQNSAAETEFRMYNGGISHRARYHTIR